MPIVVGGSGSTTAHTVSDLISETRRHLGGSSKGLLNKLSADIASGATALTTTYTASGITPNSYFAIDDEVFYTWAASGTTISDMQPGMLGSTQAAHTAGALIEVQPRFPQWFITRALQEEIMSWPSGLLFAVGTLDITLAVDQRAYDLTSIASSFYDVLSAEISPSSSDTSDKWKEVRFAVKRNFPTTTFASGTGIEFADSVGVTGQTVRVIYSKPFSIATWASSTSVETTIGIPSFALDIAPLGAAAKLLATRDIIRTDTNAQGESRSATEVPPGFITSAARALKQQRDQRLYEASATLRSQYPYKGW